MALVTLTWTASPDPVDGYRVARKEGINPFAAPVLVTETSFVDASVSENTNYQYRVEAYKGSKISAPLEITVQVTTAPAPTPVSNLTAVITY